MDTTSLRTFLAAAETGSFARAAARVFASPSTVTERIKQLEFRLGARLFDRDKRGCRLTVAGQRFLRPAAEALRTLDIAQHEIGLPARYTRSIAFGAQYVLWDQRLLAWLAAARRAAPHVAWRVTSGASARLNRDLAEGFLDFAILYDPAFRTDIRADPLFDDKLILVTAGIARNWREDYVRIEWSHVLDAEIASRLDTAPRSGLVLDLGGQSADWLIARKMAGYMPRRIVDAHLRQGVLRKIDDAPEFEFPVYGCWHRDYDPASASAIMDSLRQVQ